MKPERSQFDRRFHLATLAMQALGAWLISGGLLGCVAPIMNGQSPEPEETEEHTTKLIGDIASAWGMNYIKVESVVLVTCLDGTGSDPAPSSMRSTLVAEMQARQVDKVNLVLASPNNSLALVEAILKPGIRKGDRFDVKVSTPGRSETTSLEGGYVLQTRLRETAILANEIHTGNVVGMAEGPLLTDATAGGGSEEQGQLTHGVILNGGIALKDRPIGLVVRDEDRNVRISSMIGTAINTRFHTFDRGVKKMMAKPTRPEFIELSVHPKYANNVGRYIRVVRSIPLHETLAEQSIRIDSLTRQLLEPTSSFQASLKLEAIGKAGIKALEKGLTSPDPEVRLYSAEALAYLDSPKAAKPLGEMARTDAAFRFSALMALGSMDDGVATEELVELLDDPSSELRYGAFNALLHSDPDDALVQGESLEGKLKLHRVNSKAEPLVHITRKERAEVVLFNPAAIKLETPLLLTPGKHLVIKSDRGGMIQITRFQTGKPDQQEQCSTNLDDVIRAMVRVGASYGEIMQTIQMAKSKKLLDCRVAIDALPKPGRVYHRGEDLPTEEQAVSAKAEEVQPANQKEPSVGTGVKPAAETQTEERDFGYDLESSLPADRTPAEPKSTTAPAAKPKFEPLRESKPEPKPEPVVQPVMTPGKKAKVPLPELQLD